MIFYVFFNKKHSEINLSENYLKTKFYLSNMQGKSLKAVYSKRIVSKGNNNLFIPFQSIA